MELALSMEATLESFAMVFSREDFTSFAVILVPSWKVTSFLSLNSHVLSSICFQDAASPGFSEKSEFAPTSVSVTAAFSQIRVPPSPSAVSIDSISHISPSTSVFGWVVLCSEALF